MRIKSLYRLHRTLSIIIGIPILLWAVSGLMHPLMTSVRPAITTQQRPEYPLTPDGLRTAAPLKTVLQKAGIPEIFQARTVYMDGSWYYQVFVAANATKMNAKQTNVNLIGNTPSAHAPYSGWRARYFNLKTGRELIGGDDLYAANLARYFLDGAVTKGYSHGIPIKSIKKINDFTADYSYVNRLLPVEKVSFERADNIAIYVDTHHSRFAFALDQHRSDFNQFFGWLHTWSWMDNLPRLKAAIIAMILLLALFTAGLGIYLAVRTRPQKKPKAKTAKLTPLTRARKLHRSSAIIGAVFLISWAFSGLVHAIQNGRTPFYIQPVSNERIQTNQLPDSLNATFIHLAASSRLSGLELMPLNGSLLMAAIPYNLANGAKDLMLSEKVNATASRYYCYHPKPDSINSGAISHWEPFTENQIARLMGSLAFRSQTRTAVNDHQGYRPVNAKDTAGLTAIYLTHFTESYNFSDKVLPVWQVSKAADQPAQVITQQTKGEGPVFIEVPTGSLVKKADTFKQTDALIFAFFHKHEFMAWAGKSAKDASTVIGVIIVLILILIGYRLVFIKYRQQRKSKKH